jgi:exopolysaccharide production protein ExoQ
VCIAMTVTLGILLGTRFQGVELARAVFVVLFVAIACSVAAALAGMDFATMLHGETRGLFTHKNTLGSRAALLFMVALALLLSGWRPLLTLAALPVAVIAVILSRSAAGVAATVIVGALAPLVLTLRGSNLHVLMRIALVAAGLFALCFFMVLFRFDPMVSSLDALGRDATLTGRLLLWEVAIHHMAERPLLGTGFAAFWSGAVDWRTLLVLEELGNVLNFHNAFLEIGVQLGFLGLAVALITLIGYGRTALGALRDPAEPAPLWPVLFGLIVLALSLVEAALFMKHSLTQILLIAIPVAVVTQAGRAPRYWLGPWAGVPGVPSGAHAVEAHQAEALQDALPDRGQHQRQEIRPPRQEG